LCDPAYWRRHVREPVRFAESIAHVGIRSGDVLVEIGPTPTLIALARQCKDEPGVRWLPSLRRGRDDVEQMLESLGGLYAAGIEPAWDAFHRGRPKRKIAFPTYAFQRERHWIERTTSRIAGGAGLAAAAPRDRLIGRRVSSPALTAPVFETLVGRETVPYVVDHVVGGAVVFPATGFIELALEGAESLGIEAACVRDLHIHRALICAEHDTAVQAVFGEESGGRREVRVYAKSADGDEWTEHATGEVAPLVPLAAVTSSLEDARARCGSSLTGSEYYDRLARKGFRYGPTFQGITSIRWREGEAVAALAVPEALGPLGRHRAHPAALDAGLQAALAAAGQLDADEMFVPSSLESIGVFGSLADLAWTHVRLSGSGSGSARTADIDMTDAHGRVIAAVRGVRMVRTSAAAFRPRQAAPGTEPVYALEWEPKSLPAFRPPGASASFLPQSKAFADRLTATLGAVRESHGVDVYDALLPELDRLCARYVSAALGKLGWAPAPGDRVAAGDICERLGVLPKYERMLLRCLEMLVEDGFLERSAEGWRVLRTLETADPAADLERLREAYPTCDIELRLTGRCGAELGEVLSGRTEPLQLLFPGGSTADLEALYREAPFTRAYNTIVSDAVALALKSLPADRKIRVLEIGAGTGGTSSLVLPVMPADRTEYVFTDASNLFMVRAKERFADFRFVSYQILDIEQDPAAQGYRAGDFDLVLATNVLHATPDVRRTLRSVRTLLAPDGMLVMVEGVARQRWVDMIFGLTDGWWKATDGDRPDGYPLISRETWREALDAVGFTSFVSVPAEDRAPLFEQAVMLARAPAGARPASIGAGAPDYLLVGDPLGFAGALAARLEREGASVRVAARLAHDAGSPADAQLPSRALVHCSGADRPREPLSSEDLRSEAQRHGADLLHAIQALASGKTAPPPKLCVVTRGTQVLEAADARPHPVAATLWGMARVAALEHPELGCARIDVGPNDSAADAAERVAAELAAGDAEDQVAWRAARRYVARLAPLRLDEKPAADEAAAVALEIATRGTLDRLTVAAAVRRPPGAGEIEIRVRAAGLNFKDVLNALGTYPGDPGPLGLECAGTVSALGEGVSGLAVGDDVIAIAPGCFGSYAVTPAALAVRAPAGLTPEAAASLPAVFVTAYHALHDLAAVKSGDRVLIHAAAGGVGMAAMQIALRAGAEVFASAGTPEKRALARAMGAAHVFDSRVANFADEIMRITNGEGVDVVLNSLAGDFIERSFAVLGAGGRFIELGKNGIWEPERVAALGRGIDYRIVDVQALAAADARAVGATLLKVASLVAAGELRPLPRRSFALQEAVEAFRFVAQAKHVGKVVLRMPSPRDRAVRPDGSYLITGGFGGLGILFAGWLADRGARNIALLGRREPSAGTLEAIAALRQRGVHVQTLVGDVGRFDDVARALAQMRSTMPPLRGVLHAAGTLDDGALTQQRWDRFERVLSAKMHGTWNLDRLTRDAPLDWFVMFSSLAALLGSRGQANHAAANAFMDAFAYERRSRGMPALSINWGAWSQIGAAASDEVLSRLKSIGLGSVSPEQGVRLFAALLEAALEDRAPAEVGVLPVDWPTYVRTVHAGHPPPLLSRLGDRVVERTPASDAPPRKSTADTAPLSKRLAAARPAERQDLIVAYLREHVVRSLGLEPRRALDLRQPLSELGLDSLMAVELRTRIARGLGAERPLPATLLFDYPTIAELAEYLRRELLPEKAPAPAAPPPQDDARRKAVMELSEEEAEARLLAELSGHSSI
jgi:NADPH:quinone reductase-like Zn-dependent oxidoreductase/SAM-dependent methyltransferase